MATMPTPHPEGWKDFYAKLIIRDQVVRDIAKVSLNDLRETGLIDPNAPPPALGAFPPRNPKRKPVAPAKDLKVCIIGAGVAGLYTAFVLDALGVPYDLIEASDRFGGRIRTHYFGKDSAEAKDSEEKKWARDHYQYYDVGAMRFPANAIMARTFDAFKETETPLLTYYLNGKNTPNRYNDITVIGTDVGVEDPFKVSVNNGGTVPNEAVKDADALLNDAYDWYRMKIKRDPSVGYKYIFNHDKFSLRDYLAFVESLDSETIDWLETLNSASGWFDMAFTENIFESLDFDFGHDEIPKAFDETDDEYAKRQKEQKIHWYCIKGGTEVFTELLAAKLKKQPELNKQVVSVAYAEQPGTEHEMEVKVRSTDAPESDPEVRKYATVISTTTFAAMQKMDLKGLDLPYSYKAALRSLRYDTSTKVGIRFTQPWWINKYKIDKGGVAKTDGPLRVCVYPSYNLHNIKDPKDHPSVLLCSYTWGQDSERVASLINRQSPNNEGALKELMLRGLADLHTTNEEDSEKLYQEIKELYITHHAWDWSKDEFASGAFALFAPGNFTRLYQTLTKPVADGRFHVVGEAASCRHAWIAGALDSSIRGIHHFLVRFGLQKEIEELENRFKRTGEMDYETDYLQVALGMLKAGKRPPAGDLATIELSKPMLEAAEQLKKKMADTEATQAAFV